MNKAMELRKAWMKKLGLDPQEIEEHCSSGKANFSEELAEYQAVLQLEEMCKKIDQKNGQEFNTSN